MVELAVGFLRVELTVGRAGGLLRVVPVVVLVVATDGVFKLGATDDFGFVAELGTVRFGIEPAFNFGGVGLETAACCSIDSTRSSIANRQPEEKGGL